MGAAPVPKFVRSLVLDFPDICPQFFLGNFSRQEGKKKCTQHCIFSRGCLRVKMASKTVITVMIRFSALLPLSPPFRISASHSNKRPHSNI